MTTILSQLVSLKKIATTNHIMNSKLFFLFLCISVVFGNNEFTKANNLFTPAVYKQILSTEKGNFLFSPFSGESVLTLTLFGCKGETQKELRKCLHLPDKNAKIESELKSLLPEFQNQESFTLRSANKMYIKENLTIYPEFKKTADDVFATQSENIDFVKNTEAAKTMNAWVEQQTNNKIRNLIDPEILDDRTQLILINALYFKANWSQPFSTYFTQTISFFKSLDDVIEVNAMHSSEKKFFLYYECERLNAKFLELPFEGREASMTFVLPNEKSGLATLESKIDWVFIPHNLTWELVEVVLPKFKIESKANFKNILKNLGVVSLFDPLNADLSGIAGVQGQLFVDEVLQKSFIDVNEGGVEAAAATFVEVIAESAFLNPGKQFIADHPFIFYIKVKNVIIFAGRVTEPCD